ncbi:MAG: hypothetical protein JNL10_05495 [Verrucomicrobiales bacterium]|nr:hypothetical protein [Verrucomicrobiales bacterium]
MLRISLLASALLCIAGTARGELPLWVIPQVSDSPAEQALLASVQGVLNRDQARVWIRSRGLYEILLEDLRREGRPLKNASNVWEVLVAERDSFRGFVTWSSADGSLNAATTLAGPRRLALVEATIRDRVTALGLKEVEDVRGKPVGLEQRVPDFCDRRMAVHQPTDKVIHLRDFAIARSAFTWFDEQNGFLASVVRQLDPGARIFGWGSDEFHFVGGVSRGGGLVIPSDWALNLSALQHLPVKIATRADLPEPEPVRDGERVVAFVISDGDNVQWLLNGMATSPGFWASPERGRFAVTWEMAPILTEIAPRALDYFYRTATPRDDFIAGPSGAGYYFPSDAPDRPLLARTGGTALRDAGLRLAAVIDNARDMSGADALVSQPGVEGVLFKNYSSYNSFGSDVRWTSGKPIVSFRFLLWEQRVRGNGLKQELLPEGVAASVAAMPSGPAAGTAAFALVNVHAWSFRDSGGPIGAVARTLPLLPQGTRVVTATEFFRLLPRPR